MSETPLYWTTSQAVCRHCEGIHITSQCPWENGAAITFAPTAADVLFPWLESTPAPAQSTPPVTQFTPETAGHEYPNGMRFITHGPTEKTDYAWRMCLCGEWICFDGWEEHIAKVTATAPCPIRSGDRIATGTGAARRRLTQAEAEAGGLPEPFTRDEWRAMAQASRGAR